MKCRKLLVCLLMCGLLLVGCTAQPDAYTQLDNSELTADETTEASVGETQADSVEDAAEDTDAETDTEIVPDSAEETISVSETTPEEKTEAEPAGPVIEVIDGCTYADGVLIVNKSYAVPREYGSGITAETQAAFDAMQAAAAQEGLTLFICSGFRSYDYQNTLYNNYVARDGQAAADTYSARPGHSEHQTGLALDINSTDGSMATSAEGLWLAEHCAEYGFVIRYPKGKEHITGYMYEPWHIRYLGTDLAAELTSSGLTVEEYFGLTSAYPEG